MNVQIRIGTSRVAIDQAVFVKLLDNSVANARATYRRALETSEITFQQLIEIARVGDIPYSLFFAPLPVVDAQIRAKYDKLLQGITKKTFSLNSRNWVELRDIELIIKDLLRKQEILKAKDESLIANPLIGTLRRQGRTPEEDAGKLMGLLGITSEDLRGASTKEAAFELLIDRLEANQVLVAQSQNNFMPQQLRGIKFSGITVKDPKVPYIFMKGGGDDVEPAGRRVFTVALMSVLIARGIFAPVTYDGYSTGVRAVREYEIVAQMLMPAAAFRHAPVGSLDAVKTTADIFKVTPSAVAVRGLRLRIISQERASAYLNELRAEFDTRKPARMNQPLPVNALRKYNGREFSRRMLQVYDNGQISPKDFCRVVCQNKLKPNQIEDFRAVVH